jgi:tripartite-type tricarboxylate transporter receptor subunit TctC
MKKMMVFFALLILASSGLAMAQTFPTKPINVVVSAAAGGTTDIPTRVLASKAEKILGQTIIVTNKGGGGGAVALGPAKSDPPDGYHLVSHTSVAMMWYQQFRDLPYSHEDFVPVLQWGHAGAGVVVKADSPWKTLKDLVEYAKKNPGKVTYSSIGVNSPPHLVMQYIGKKEGARWTHVPFAGGAPGVTSLLGGHITAMAGSMEWAVHVQEGSLRILAIFEDARMSQFPDAPTAKELGYNYPNDPAAGYLISAPKGTPVPILNKLADAFHKAMEDPEFIKTMERMEMKILYRNSKDAEKYLNDAVRNLKEAIRELDIPRETPTK